MQIIRNGFKPSEMDLGYQKWSISLEMDPDYQKLIQIEMIQNQIVRNDSRILDLVTEPFQMRLRMGKL